VEDVAAQIVQALRAGTRRRQLGWPEKLFAWLNSAFPALVDRGLLAALPVVRRHAPIDQQPSSPAKSFAAAPSPQPGAMAFDRRVAATPATPRSEPAERVQGRRPELPHPGANAARTEAATAAHVHPSPNSPSYPGVAP
jgi:hypothetical protein